VNPKDNADDPSGGQDVDEDAPPSDASKDAEKMDKYTNDQGMSTSTKTLVLQTDPLPNHEMSQIFHHSTNTFARVVIFGAVFILGFLTWVVAG
jgi:hypothetical protein